MLDDMDVSAAAGGVAGATLGFWIGVMIGAGLALLFAPASGRETRRRIQATAQEVSDRAAQFGQQVQDRLDRAGSAVRKGIDEFQRREPGVGAGSPSRV